jgi:hypothetical protein
MRTTGKVTVASALIGIGFVVIHLALDSVRQNDSRVFLWGGAGIIALFVICVIWGACRSAVARLLGGQREPRRQEPASDERVN